MNTSRRSFIKLSVGCAATLLTGQNAVAASKGRQRVTILHINDVHGRIDATDIAIGYPKIAAYIKEMKKIDPNTLALDAGDTYHGTAIATVDDCEGVADILSVMSLDAHTLGNNDFTRSKKTLMKLAKRVPFPTIVGNIRAKGGNFVPEYAIITLPNNLKIGLVPLTAHYGFYDLGLPTLEDLYSKDILSTAVDLVNKIRPKVDIVVALNHLGVNDVPGAINCKDFARAVPGVDVIIDGHSHTILPQGMIENDVLIAQAGCYSQFIGVVELEIEDGKVVASNARLVSKAEIAELPDDQETRKAVDKTVTRNDVLLDNKIGHTKVDLAGSREIIRTRETNLGNMLTDSIRESLNSDIAFLRAGGISGDIPAGDITVRDFYNTITRSEVIIVKKVLGEHILGQLETNADYYPKPNGLYFHVSGLTYRMNPNKPSGSRIYDVKVGGKPLDKKQYYSLAMVLGQVGEDANIRDSVTITYGEEAEYIFFNYIKTHSPLNPVVDGRAIVDTI